MSDIFTVSGPLALLASRGAHVMPILNATIEFTLISMAYIFFTSI
jgi:hypothetical protein